MNKVSRSVPPVLFSAVSGHLSSRPDSEDTDDIDRNLTATGDDRLPMLSIGNPSYFYARTVGICVYDGEVIP